MIIFSWNLQTNGKIEELGFPSLYLETTSSISSLKGADINSNPIQSNLSKYLLRDGQLSILCVTQFQPISNKGHIPANHKTGEGEGKRFGRRFKCTSINLKGGAFKQALKGCVYWFNYLLSSRPASHHPSQQELMTA